MGEQEVQVIYIQPASGQIKDRGKEDHFFSGRGF